ncbi:MAG: glycerophosphodiester phosphodiesterase [Deltaproteobacteria bacterium HGW-Deltaproteobacteria-18]|jgi:glycerophosphoryl diester phosphodiesterase|nr:MAG: glycerophosphodiester phosphodiesterase [Deltaproteobacteria bacterium HGW-Deltaproteobacteria-18]
MIFPLPRIWAHRGARSAAPENTMAAARAALAQGAFGWELDVHITLDGEIIVTHDHGLRRVTDIALRPDMPVRARHVVNRLTLAQIRSLDAGSWFVRRDPFGTVARGEIAAGQLASFAGESIPTLAEALDWTRESGLAVNVEIKDMLGGDDDGLVREVVRLIRASGIAQRVLVSSFRQNSLELFRKLCPEVPVGLLLDEKAMAASTQEIVARLQSLGAEAVNPSIKGLYPGRIAAFREAGFEVNVYTVNREEDMHRLAREGAAGIITDFPARALAVLEAFRQEMK